MVLLLGRTAIISAPKEILLACLSRRRDMVWLVLETLTLCRSPMETGKISFAIDEQEQMPGLAYSMDLTRRSTSSSVTDGVHQQRSVGFEGKLSLMLWIPTLLKYFYFSIHGHFQLALLSDALSSKAILYSVCSRKVSPPLQPPPLLHRFGFTIQSHCQPSSSRVPGARNRSCDIPPKQQPPAPRQ